MYSVCDWIFRLSYARSLGTVAGLLPCFSTQRYPGSCPPPYPKTPKQVPNRPHLTSGKSKIAIVKESCVRFGSLKNAKIVPICRSLLLVFWALGVFRQQDFSIRIFFSDYSFKTNKQQQQKINLACVITGEQFAVVHRCGKGRCAAVYCQSWCPGGPVDNSVERTNHG